MPISTHIVLILFLFVLGSCVGSFLNVVVWRLPRGQSLSHPPSRCPKCEKRLAWYDNIPVFGWIKLRGKCRYCALPISPKYPIVEAITGLIFVFYYVMFFIVQVGPCAPWPPVTIGDGVTVTVHRLLQIDQDWAIFGLYLFTISALLAGSLIDADFFIIPSEITLWLAAIGLLVHTLVDHPRLPGALTPSPAIGAMAAGGAIGLLISLALRHSNLIPLSFPKGEPLLEVDKEDGKVIEDAPPDMTPGQIRLEIRKEFLFLTPPILLGILGLLIAQHLPAWSQLISSYDWLGGLLGSIFGALMGGFVVWITRILGTLGFGRVAMGLGDVDLMFAVGACIGAGGAVIAFFLAPFFGILVAVYLLLTGTRRELPYGPYLSMATAFVMLFYCPIAEYFAGGMQGLIFMIGGRP
jgi:leader peptidase (prepilin peptidase)/N-methyltransferase